MHSKPSRWVGLSCAFPNTHIICHRYGVKMFMILCIFFFFFRTLSNCIQALFERWIVSRCSNIEVLFYIHLHIFQFTGRVYDWAVFFVRVTAYAYFVVFDTLTSVCLKNKQKKSVQIKNCVFATPRVSFGLGPQCTVTPADSRSSVGANDCFNNVNVFYGTLN